MTNELSSMTSVQLKRATRLKEKIETLTEELQQIFGAGNPSNSPASPKKRQMSAAGRAAIRAGQKARWAKVKSTELVAKKNRKMSAAARARISAAAKKRWAQAFAAGKTRL